MLFDQVVDLSHMAKYSMLLDIFFFLKVCLCFWVVFGLMSHQMGLGLPLRL